MAYRRYIENVARDIFGNIIVILIFSHIYWLKCDDDKDFCIYDCVLYVYSL